ncbi:hypothetical protein BMETH_20541122134, partial [methanotrophic bacterial endosymbiont of Bathymodiolus sp.]
ISQKEISEHASDLFANACSSVKLAFVDSRVGLSCQKIKI